jgi:ribosome biogenesis GTPase
MGVKLETIGWSSFFEKSLETIPHEGLTVARVVREGRDRCHVVGEMGELLATISGRLRHRAKVRSDLPAVGDWVVIQPPNAGGPALIHAVLPRRTALERKSPGSLTQTQVVAANIDVVFVVGALDGGRNFNLRRFERYLALVRESGAAPVLLLNKCDLCEEVDALIEEARTVTGDVPVLAVSALTGQGMAGLKMYFKKGRTTALIGPSGVGKSALVNALAGDAEAKETGEVRDNDKRGRHTTTYREILPLPGGALIFDTPGLREIQIWGDGESLADVFPDIEELTAQCRFRDCRHDAEPGCAVQAAIASGALDERRLDHYRQLAGELAELSEKQNRRTQILEKRALRKVHHDFELRSKAKRRGLSSGS